MGRSCAAAHASGVSSPMVQFMAAGKRVSTSLKYAVAEHFKVHHQCSNQSAPLERSFRLLDLIHFGKGRCTFADAPRAVPPRGGVWGTVVPHPNGNAALFVFSLASYPRFAAAARCARSLSR
jgi:hypothetical protein